MLTCHKDVGNYAEVPKDVGNYVEVPKGCR